MKRIALILVVFISVGISTGISQKKNTTDKTEIILVNPGVFYLKSLNYLNENKIIDIENVEYQAVFYTRNEISYDDAKKYIKENNIENIVLSKVNGDLTPDNLFERNSCTQSFVSLFENSDGIIFLGGADIPSGIFGQKTSLLAGIKTPNRHYFELSFLYHLLGRAGDDYTPLLESNPEYVVYGICLGMQTMNVATGGDMYQDIPSEVYGLQYVEDVLALGENKIHKNYWRNIDTNKELTGHSFHQIKFTDNPFFTKKLKQKKNYQPYIVSSHHQAIKNIGKGFEVAAISLDGKIVEAIYHSKYKNVLGVQFHPEFYYIHDPDSKKFKVKTGDQENLTEHEIIKGYGSYPFHLRYWEYFSDLF
ncbi:MAG: gamma-glutamyl-gamma-aminobutyrate hydrolase family protein [Bacteroidota bacterium]